MSELDFLQQYIPETNTWDEMFNSNNTLRKPYEKIIEYLSRESLDDLNKKEELARKLFLSQGITFTVYNSGEGIEKIFPFDIIPRIITAQDWALIEKGIKQRLRALNIFLKDIYSNMFIVKDGVIPIEMIYSCPHFLREMHNVKVPHDIYVHIAGIDLIRDFDGSFYVLEDNLRTPSGVSYMLENREITKRLFPDLLPQCKVRSVTEYPEILYRNLMAISPRQISNPTIVLLSPGIYNSAYFEHTTLARLMGVELVEGRDLLVDNHKVYMKTTNGRQQVDVIYRRVDDEYLDPLVFNPESILGVAGMMSAYRKGNVAIVNAIGNGVADDKAIYTYVPQMIKYYLNEEPLLKNVPTYQLGDPEHKEYVFDNIHKMVIKKTNGSGGYGMLMGHMAGNEEIKNYKADIEKEPRQYIAQPTISLSTAPCFLNTKLRPRRIDLRPFALCGPDGIEIVPGGLTRVALQEGSLIVNSSQGGGSKDTWVLAS
ncbi:putative circularly permuted ATP-grasp superfamily protein [Arcticibacter tournemirensis]|uniref:Circularly permuted type 2 ATP-grasp protein n=1 Tax=Arcticibacter tournemirensis TaxID=699437 RepID=A0A5M9H6P3_9SPHI|nr:circularly permuted type 2 ATP-grasp protein [Arcticibacter tournemirensis]KAA8482270.1 circularly permuted type 2 ATP-grasp protein [Arcticibacter tournemirensis]TQM52410.1 putative circularly permuted ATP-grasp superfamily protein [Arcticibacter tournemirensis]